MLARMSSNRNSHSLLVGMQNGATSLENSLAVLKKSNIFFPYNAAIMLGIYTNELKTYPHKNLSSNVCTNLIHNWHNLEAINILQGANDKEAVVHPDNKTLFSTKRK